MTEETKDEKVAMDKEYIIYSLDKDTIMSLYDEEEHENYNEIKQAVENMSEEDMIRICNRIWYLSQAEFIDDDTMRAVKEFMKEE